MQGPKIEIYKLPDLERLSNDELLEIAQALGIDTSPHVTRIKGKDVLWTQEKRKVLTQEILGKNPSILEVETQKLQKLNRIYLVWAMVSTLLALLLSLYRLIEEKDTTKLYLNGSFIDVRSSEQQQLDSSVFTLFDVSGLTFGPLTMGKNIYLRGRVVDTTENFYIVDFSNAIQGLNNKSLVRLSRTRRIENK